MSVINKFTYVIRDRHISRSKNYFIESYQSPKLILENGSHIVSIASMELHRRCTQNKVKQTNVDCVSNSRSFSDSLYKALVKWKRVQNFIPHKHIFEYKTFIWLLCGNYKRVNDSVEPFKLQKINKCSNMRQ